MKTIISQVCWTSPLLLAIVSSVGAFAPHQVVVDPAARQHQRQCSSLTPSSLASSWTSSVDVVAAPSTPSNIKDVWGIEPNIQNFPGANFPLGSSSIYTTTTTGGGATTTASIMTIEDQQAVAAPPPPILELPNFLTAQECQAIREWAKTAIDNGAEECDDYLNYRVNQEVDQDGASSEGKELIDEFNVSEDSLSAQNKGGFRVRLDNSIVQGMLRARLLDVLGMPNRDFVFEEGAWIRPTPRTVVVRDQTVVYYGESNGVPPHVDGKDGTLLVYLNDVPEGVGGRTVFPEDGFSQTPVQGTALLYRSKTELLHYSEAMTGSNDKWIMQLLLDYNHDYKPGDTITCFRTGTQYVWHGTSE